MEYRAIMTGAVLAGGKSARLGRDKCALTLGRSENLLARSIRLLRGLLRHVVVIGREYPGAESLPDAVPDAGPAAAITAALRHTGGPCLVLACDLPFMREKTLALLIQAWEKKRPDTLVTAFRHPGDGKKENLVAVYEPGALAFLEPRLQRNLLKLALIVPEKRYGFVEIPADAAEDFFNLNRPEDLREAERRLL